MSLLIALLCLINAGLSSSGPGALVWLATGVIWVVVYCREEDRKGLTMAGKRYYAANPEKLPITEFELVVWRDGVEETHEFKARPQADAGAMMQFSRSGEDGEAKAEAVFRMMSKMLMNTDGVPAQWSPRPVPKPKNAGPDYQPKFRAPSAPSGDGKLHPMSEAERWTDPARGSSRRRWDYLMFEDRDVTVDIGVVSEILEDLVGAAAGLPTNG